MELQLELPSMPPPVPPEEERRAVERIMGMEEGALEGEIVIEETPEAAVAEAMAEERAEYGGEVLPTPYNAGAVQAAMPASPTPSERFAEMQRLAEIAEASGCFPGQTKIMLLTKMLRGAAVGLDPAISIETIVGIRNNNSFTAEMQRSLLERAGYELREIQSTNQICELELWKNEKLVGKCSFTLDEAKAAGLLRSDAWQKWTKDMLFARATTRLVSRFASWIQYWERLPYQG